MRFLFVLAVVVLCGCAIIAATSGAVKIDPDALQAHIEVLASDSLEGREVGESGEWKAAQYLIAQFTRSGLEPKGIDGYLQPFEFVKRISFTPNNSLVVNGDTLAINDEWVPLSHSANASFNFERIIPVEYGIVTTDSSYNDYADRQVEGQAVLIKRYAPPDSVNPHADFSKYSSFTDKILTAINHKAAAVFFVTPSDRDDTIQFTGVTHVTPKNIPIIFLRRKGLERLGLRIDAPEITSAIGRTELVPVKDTGYNVLGYLAGTTDTTIVVGAHYDHLGWGTTGSRYMEKERKIHYGADDNGSGTAGLIELAAYFGSDSHRPRHSMLFAAFSGEEAGILGSSHFARRMTIDTTKILMMLNMDMIGRLREQESGLAVFGTGTASEFQAYFKELKRDDLKLAFREPGTGPSDHTAFYNNGIPVLHFFTGAHEDYHKPADTPEKIDREGTAKVVSFVAEIIEHFDSTSGPLTFQKTKDPDSGRRMSSFDVTLGIMPDYVAQVKGVKVDGVSPDRPGERAGIIKGDIIIRMGSLVIDDIYAYMNALSKFRKGDSTVVAVERGADTLDLPVVFK